MIRQRKFKASISTVVLAAICAAGCKAPTPLEATSQTADIAAPPPKLAPIRKALSCLPESAAIIAAHRGTDERWRDIAENSISGLKALIDHGALMAEIDVAGLKDGTHITFMTASGTIFQRAGGLSPPAKNPTSRKYY